MADTDDEHLSQQEITGIKDTLEELGRYLKAARFEAKEEGVEKCADKNLPKAAEALFNALGFHQKVSSSAFTPRIKY